MALNMDKAEQAALRARRSMWLGERPSAGQQTDLGASAAHEPPIRALALSGGGIRSATFSLGVLQAIAEARTDAHAPSTSTSVDTPSPASASAAPGAAQAAARSPFSASLLSTFDYLSTVSGGGYLGGFLCSLFVPGRLVEEPGATTPDAQRLKAADHATAVLMSGPPTRIRSQTDYSDLANLVRAPLAWLRENGRYLTPTGMGDVVYAAALIVRNWLSLHMVVGLLLMALLALLGLLRMGFMSWGGAWYAAQEAALLADALKPGGAALGIWWSPLVAAAALPVLSLGVWCGIAYWLVMECENGGARPLSRNPAFWVMVLISGIATALCIAWWPPAAGAPRTAPVQALLPLVYVAASTAAASLIYLVLQSVRPLLATELRQALTQGVAVSLWLALALLGVGVVDTLGQTLYLPLSSSSELAALSPAAAVAGLVWLARSLATKEGKTLPAWVAKLPLSTLAGVAGLLIMVLVGGLWALFVNWLTWGGMPPSGEGLASIARQNVAWGVLLVAGGMSFSSGFFAGFLNQSSLQHFYASRLTRAYLGASNRERFIRRGHALSSAEPLAGDQLTVEDYWRDDALQTLAPLHLVNVTVNKTVDPSEQLVQRDRKGQPLSVWPWGLSLDGRAAQPFPSANLSVGQWIATSGAAFATGIGRETSLGMSLLMGAANVRLGLWFDTGMGKPGSGKASFLPGEQPVPLAVRRILGGVFKTQRYLMYEFQARFHGTKRQWQYLSDGGHFENTALYELLRPQRRHVDQVFVCDCGADPDYRFGDLGNLIRLARIDLGVDVSVEDPASFGPGNPLRDVMGGTADFRRHDGKPQASSPIAMLLYAVSGAGTSSDPRRVTQIVLIKPHVTWASPLEVREHTRVSQAFPQDTTADQFYDEAQWESYRALGHWQGKAVFKPEVLDALHAHHQARRAALRAA